MTKAIGKIPSLRPKNKLQMFWWWLLFKADQRGWLDGTIYEGQGGYCPRCSGCGCDGCCSPRMCDKGVFCVNLYTEDELKHPERFE